MKHPFLRYVLYNIESSLASSDEMWMRAYADLVAEEEIRTRLLGKIMDERRRAQVLIDELLPVPLEQRRPRFWQTLQVRQETLSLLHERQIQLLKRHREDPDGETTVKELSLLVINAIAAGLRTTG